MFIWFNSKITTQSAIYPNLIKATNKKPPEVLILALKKEEKHNETFAELRRR